MKTWEMIKALTENPKKKFHIKDAKGMVGIKAGCIQWLDKNPECNQTLTLTELVLRDLVWEEVKEPVDFMTAIRAYDDGEVIYVLHGENGKYKETFDPSSHETDWGYAVVQHQGYPVDSGLIISGKWYIED